MRLVFDTNFYLAALKRGSYAEFWLLAAKHGDKGLKLFVSPDILHEVQHKLETKFTFEREEAVAFIQNIQLAAQTINPTQKLSIITRDPDDNKILECAAEAKAHLIVTIDKDLLQLKRFEQAGIIHPRDLKYIFPT